VRSSQNQGRNLGRQRRAPPSHSVLLTVSNHCTLRFRRKRRLLYPHSCTPPLLVTIKEGGGLPLAQRDILSLSGFLFSKRTLSTTEHSSQPTPLLAETWELPSLSLLACIPCYKHSGCKIIQCPRTPPLLDVRPRGRNQDKLCVTVLPLASSSGMRKHAAFTSWDPGPLGRDTDSWRAR
jgi:hypothetical protein